ncbi:MAG: glycoside hydrolase family 36 protein [Phycisphaerae bacterium]
MTAILLQRTRLVPKALCLALMVTPLLSPGVRAAAKSQSRSHTHAVIIGSGLRFEASRRSGDFAFFRRGQKMPVLRACMGARVNRGWLYANAYPQHRLTVSKYHDALGSGQKLVIRNFGLANGPELIEQLVLYRDAPYGTLQAQVKNTSGRQIHISSLRVLNSLGHPSLSLGASNDADRILSDSFSENHPMMAIHGLRRRGIPGGLGFAVGSQLVYNRASHASIFFGALTARRLLTVLRLKTARAAGRWGVTAWTADCTGTTAAEIHQSLRHDPALDRVWLRLPLAPNKAIASERLMITAGPGFLSQLQEYGHAVRVYDHARIGGPVLMGWWSWTAYYFGLNQATALTNADWLSRHLRRLGYRYFHIDEGYDYARGQYTRPNTTMFPGGMRRVGRHITRKGLHFGIWTAPFEVSHRAWVFRHHPGWMVHNAQGKPIPLGHVSKGRDQLYALDPTNPEAQRYLYHTYRVITRQWDVRYIKLDFMDDAAIEGYHYRPQTTALQAQRIGLRIIRHAVGPRVVLDKDGSPMLSPVGLVDAGRISVDTGRSFQASRDAATGIASRFYMNRNFFIDDPDAFSVSRELITDRHWHQSKKPLSLSAARVAITLAAVAGGMFEIGDDLPTLGSEPRRLALVENRDLLDMVRLQRAALPLDLMNFHHRNRQPGIFFLREDKRQSMLAVFNWTRRPRLCHLSLAYLSLPVGTYRAYDALRKDRPIRVASRTIDLRLAPRSVRLVKLINAVVPAQPPRVTVRAVGNSRLDQPVRFIARCLPGSVPAVRYPPC